MPDREKESGVWLWWLRSEHTQGQAGRGQWGTKYIPCLRAFAPTAVHTAVFLLQGLLGGVYTVSASVLESCTGWVLGLHEGPFHIRHMDRDTQMTLNEAGSLTSATACPNKGWVAFHRAGVLVPSFMRYLQVLQAWIQAEWAF